MLPPKFLNHSLSNSTVNFDRSDLINKPKPQQRHLLRSDQEGTKDGTIGNATGAILRGGTAAGSRVEIAIRVRYKLIFFKTKRRQIVVEADFEFNGKGIERGGGWRERRLNEEEVGGKGD
ncbi:hypothetical protein LINPERHAP1_LOCUS4664 [Linum perenne]